MKYRTVYLSKFLFCILAILPLSIQAQPVEECQNDLFVELEKREISMAILETETPNIYRMVPKITTGDCVLPITNSALGPLKAFGDGIKTEGNTTYYPSTYGQVNVERLPDDSFLVDLRNSLNRVVLTYRVNFSATLIDSDGVPENYRLGHSFDKSVDKYYRRIDSFHSDESSVASIMTAERVLDDPDRFQIFNPNITIAHGFLLEVEKRPYWIPKTSSPLKAEVHLYPKPLPDKYELPSGYGDGSSGFVAPEFRKRSSETETKTEKKITTPESIQILRLEITNSRRYLDQYQYFHQYWQILINGVPLKKVAGDERRTTLDIVEDLAAGKYTLQVQSVGFDSNGERKVITSKQTKTIYVKEITEEEGIVPGQDEITPEEDEITEEDTAVDNPVVDPNANPYQTFIDQLESILNNSNQDEEATKNIQELIELLKNSFDKAELDAPQNKKAKRINRKMLRKLNRARKAKRAKKRKKLMRQVRKLNARLQKIA